jgi:hypothetical protein
MLQEKWHTIIESNTLFYHQPVEKTKRKKDAPQGFEPEISDSEGRIMLVAFCD